MPFTPNIPGQPPPGGGLPMPPPGLPAGGPTVPLPMGAPMGLPSGLQPLLPGAGGLMAQALGAGGPPPTNGDPMAALSALAGGMGGGMGGGMPPPIPDVPPMPGKGDLIPRDKPEPTEQRAALVKQLIEAVKAAKGRWKPVFKKMREDMDFALGKQWPAHVGSIEDERYVANIVQRHVQQRTAVLYAKNPKAVAKRKERMDYTIWDGTESQYQQAEQGIQQAALAGLPPPQPFLLVVQDHDQCMERRKLLDRLGKTLEILYQHYTDEQVFTFKSEMKRMVRRTITCGVGYVKLGFQRVMGKSPDIERQLADFHMQLAHLQTMSADIADGEVDPQAPQAERVRLMIQALQAQPDVLLREGLTFDFPASTAIIPDAGCRSLSTFAGCDWVAEEFILSSEEVRDLYQVDVKTSYNAYTEQHDQSAMVNESIMGGMDAKGRRRDVLVWLVYHEKDGLVYTLCDGYPDFLEEPAAPVPLLERFYPWFALMFNELEHETQLFPVSDVRLLRHQQKEYNRSREGMREHRMANRPMTAVANGTLDDEDKEKLESRPANAIVELNGLQPGQKVEDVLQAVRPPPIDPALYDPGATFQDVLRVVGTQEANLGGTSNATATESSIAEGSRMSSMESNVDDLDDMLTVLARSGGQVMLAQLDQQTVKDIVGAGAAWPQIDRKTIASEVLLQVEAGSAGRPNKVQDIQNLERIMPFLMQLPGVNPEWLAKEAVRRMDDRIDLDQAVSSGSMSAMAMNAQAQGGAPGGPPQKGGPPGQGAGGAPPGGPPPDQSGGTENQQKPMQSQNQPPHVGRPPMQPVSPQVALHPGA